MDLVRKEGANRTPSGLDGAIIDSIHQLLEIPTRFGFTQPSLMDLSHSISWQHSILTRSIPCCCFALHTERTKKTYASFFYRRCLESLPAAANQNNIDLTDAALAPTKWWNPTTGLFDCTRMKKDLRTQLKYSCWRNQPLSKNLVRNLRSCRRALRPSQTPG